MYPGTCSPMENIEEYITAIVVQKIKMNQPLTCKEGLMLANNLIKGTSIERKVIVYKKKKIDKYGRVKNA